MSFKNYVWFRVKTYGVVVVGIFLGLTGVIAIVAQDLVIGLVMFAIGGVGVLYARYEWREHDIKIEQRKRRR